jgi:hypothetical protein
VTYRIYLRSPDQKVSDKTATGDPAAALAAFDALVNRCDLDGTPMLAVLNADGKPIAHHDFRLRQDGSPHDPAKYWRGRTGELDVGPGKAGRPTEMEGGKRVNVYLDEASLQRAAELGNGNVSEGIRIALQISADTKGRE